MDLDLKGSYLPNFAPSGPVDYVLVAMEPSTGVSGGHDGGDSGPALNFSWSVDDFILHYCVRRYLCRSGESYHLTDLSKGSTTVKDAGVRRRAGYERWYPLLRDELALLNKAGRTRLITAGRVVEDFLSRKGLCEQVERVLRYGRASRCPQGQGDPAQGGKFRGVPKGVRPAGLPGIGTGVPCRHPIGFLRSFQAGGRPSVSADRVQDEAYVLLQEPFQRVEGRQPHSTARTLSVF